MTHNSSVFRTLFKITFPMASMLSLGARANPYFNPSDVPNDEVFFKKTDKQLSNFLAPKVEFKKLNLEQAQGSDVMRVQIDWSEGVDAKDIFTLSDVVIEPSGTDSLKNRNTKPMSPFGSYKSTLSDPTSGKILAWDSIGTGKEFRKLSRAISFRFPKPESPVLLKFIAENPQTGEMQLVFEKLIDPSTATKVELPDSRKTTDVTLIREATKSPKLIFSIYSEGYTENRFRAGFIRDAYKVVKAFEEVNLPYLEHFEFRAVFALSGNSLGTARNLGLPVADRDSFLGLYFPYWEDFGRWYHVLYPTRVKHYRESIGQVAYDYPLALVDNAYYWGVGNFKELTAIPAESNYFAYLLTHEFGHFLGLNEEYEGGGRTELEFAPQIEEPWSQNITFLENSANLKWKEWVSHETPLPTPTNFWNNPIDPSKPYGAFAGGYADSPANQVSYKPGYSCVMESGRHFCSICLNGMAEVIARDLGIN